ncbi:MAG: glycosyltransferase family 4 protein [Nitrososphaeria archaeon]
MRILMVTREYGKFIVGGAGVATTKLVKYLRLEGAEVHVLSFGDPSYNNEFDHYISPRGSILTESRQVTNIPSDIMIFHDILRLTKEAKRLAKTYGCEVIHVQEPYVGGLITFDERKITTIHDTSYGEIKAIKEGGFNTVQDVKKLAFYSSMGYAMELLSIATSRLLITPSNIAKRELVDAYGVSHEKVVVIHNGVEMPDISCTKEEARAILGLPDDKLIIFTAARHIPCKRFDMLIKSIYELCYKDKRLHDKLLVIIGGSGFMTPQLKKMAVKCGLNNILFPGWISSEKLPFYYLSSDIYAFTSNRESAPLALLEACSYGLPIVTTMVGDYAALMKSGHDAIVIKPNSATELAKSLLLLIEDEKLRRKLSRNAGEFAKQFSWKGVAQKHLEIYEALIRG